MRCFIQSNFDLEFSKKNEEQISLRSPLKRKWIKFTHFVDYHIDFHDKERTSDNTWKYNNMECVLELQRRWIIILEKTNEETYSHERT